MSLSDKRLFYICIRSYYFPHSILLKYCYTVWECVGQHSAVMHRYTLWMWQRCERGSGACVWAVWCCKCSTSRCVRMTHGGRDDPHRWFWARRSATARHYRWYLGCHSTTRWRSDRTVTSLYYRICFSVRREDTATRPRRWTRPLRKRRTTEPRRRRRTPASVCSSTRMTPVRMHFIVKLRRVVPGERSWLQLGWWMIRCHCYWFKCPPKDAGGLWAESFVWAGAMSLRRQHQQELLIIHHSDVLRYLTFLNCVLHNPTH